VLADELEVVEDASPGEWIAPRLGGEFGAVTLAVPSGYAAYARICHPATEGGDAPVTWSQVASATGRTAHPLMQWHALVGSPDYLNFKGSLWPGGDPERGNLDEYSLEVLCGLLGRSTTDAERCFFAVWDGWSWVHGGDVIGRIELVRPGLVGTGSGSEPTARASAAFSAAELSRPRLVLPGREYVLLSGPLSAAGKIGDPGGLRGFEPRSPNLFWPADHAWCVASEIDFDSTLVGGTAELIRAILDEPGLDAWPVGPEDSLAYDADRINS
jgi:hypothetical protein